MEGPSRRTGIDVVGNAPWGTHLCQFYQSKQDLIETLVPYFRQGLADHEFCMWVTSEPLGVEDAKAALRSVEPALDDCLARGQIEILDYTQWYTRSGRFDADEVLEGWVEKLDGAVERGYEGLRLTGNTFWLEDKDWADFTAYEEAVNRVIGQYRMLALCTYSLDKCGAPEITDVVSNHQFALVKRAGRWQRIESSEHQKSEAALRESQEDLHRAQAVAHLGSWRLDVRRNELTWSDEAYRMFGIARGTPLTYESFLAAVHPDDRDDVDGKWRAALRGEPYDIEHRILAGGQVKWVREQAVLELDEHGTLLGGFGTVQDITERKRAEAEIVSFARFPSENPFPVLRVRRDALLLHANPASKPLLEDRGCRIGEPVPDEWRAWVQEALESGSGKSVEVEHGRRTLSFEVVPVPDGGYVNLYGRDITTRKRMLDALRRAYAELEERVQARTRELAESTELLERMFDNTHILLAHLDRDFHFLRVNRAYAEAEGREPGFFVGKNHFALYPHEENQAIFRRVVETGQPYAVYAKPFVYSEHPERGVTFWDWSVHPLRGPQGRVSGVLLSLLNVTERKRLENELIEVEERDRREIGQELHDTVGQQLTGIAYALDNLEAALTERAAPEAARVAELRGALDAADAQVRRLSRGLYPAQIASGGLCGVLEDLARHVTERHGVACSFDCPAECRAPAGLDAPAGTQLYRIAQEAVNNALKHGKPRQIRMSLSAREGQITLSVRDNGVGIRPDLTESKGLGLHIMAYRASTIGGVLRVQPGAEGGTVVSCSVPTRGSAAQERTP